MREWLESIGAVALSWAIGVVVFAAVVGFVAGYWAGHTAHRPHPLLDFDADMNREADKGAALLAFERSQGGKG